MARITRDIFDPLQSYISVRLQQGVPLVDADWNEAQDVRKFEVQAFLKWFVGNGVPEDNDGFHIAGLTSVRVGNNPPVWDFVIECGVGAAPDGTSHVEQGLRHVGRCLVDGMDVLIAANINFRAQELHVSRGRAATDLASLLGVPTIADVPVGNDPEIVYLVVVYLDVWERLVTPDEEPGLVHSGLGVESSVRLKREWVVRARAGSSVPTPNDPSDLDESIRFIAGHSYYALATIAHKGEDPITDDAITDQRERRRLMPPATLLEDLFGPVDYRRGQGRPIVNLREAINALLRGELPGTPEAPIGPEGHINLGHATFFDAAHGLITIWRSGQERPWQIFAARLDLAKPEAGFRTIKQITGPTSRHHHATLLDTGEVLLVYETVDAAPNIVMKRGPFDTLADAPVITVTDTAAGEHFPFAVAVGKQVLILWHEDADNTLKYTWYDPHSEHNPFRQARKLSDDVYHTEFFRHGPHAAVDSTNSVVWVAFIALLTDPDGGRHTEIRVIDVPPNPDELPGQPQLLSTGSVNENPFVMVDSRDNVWVFWTSEGNLLRYRRFLRATRAWEAEETQTSFTFGWEPTAVSDTEGGIWVSGVSGEGNIWYARYSPVTQIWSEPRPITSSRGEAEPFVLRGPDGSFWLFWHRAFSIDICRLFYRRIFPLI